MLKNVKKCFSGIRVNQNKKYSNVNCLVFSNCYNWHCKYWYLQNFCLRKKWKMLQIIIIIITVFLKLWYCQIIWYLFAGFKVIILCSFHSIWFVKYVFSAKLRFVKPSTRLVKYKSRVLKSNPELVNNSIVDHLEQCGLFSDFHKGFRSSRSTADLLKVVSDRIARAFNRSGFELFWMESFHKNIQLMLEFLKDPFLVLHFSCYALINLLAMLCYL